MKRTGPEMTAFWLSGNAIKAETGKKSNQKTMTTLGLHSVCSLLQFLSHRVQKPPGLRPDAHHDPFIGLQSRSDNPVRLHFGRFRGKPLRAPKQEQQSQSSARESKCQ